MSLTNDFETRALQWLFTNGTPTRPTAWHLALFTTAPGEAGGGTEVSGSGYARLNIGASGLSVSGNLATNSAALEFAAASGGAWGTITHVAIFDAATTGNMIAYGALSASRTIADGDIFRIPAGDLDITLD